MTKMINHPEKINRRAFVSEKFWHDFWQNTFSAESISRPDGGPLATLELKRKG
jgi:hypothetical protein